MVGSLGQQKMSRKERGRRPAMERAKDRAGRWVGDCRLGGWEAASSPGESGDPCQAEAELRARPRCDPVDLHSTCRESTGEPPTTT
jgi:hypothetical protein